MRTESERSAGHVAGTEITQHDVARVADAALDGLLEDIVLLVFRLKSLLLFRQRSAEEKWEPMAGSHHCIYTRCGRRRDPRCGSAYTKILSAVQAHGRGKPNSNSLRG